MLPFGVRPAPHGAGPRFACSALIIAISADAALARASARGACPAAWAASLNKWTSSRADFAARSLRVKLNFMATSSGFLRRPPWAALEERQIDSGDDASPVIATECRRPVQTCSCTPCVCPIAIGQVRTTVGSCGGVSRGADRQVQHQPCCAIIANARISKFAHNGEGQCAPVTARTRRTLRQ